jgi:hypothetical protein
MDRQEGRKSGRQKSRKAEKQEGRQTNRPTDRKIEGRYHGTQIEKFVDFKIDKADEILIWRKLQNGDLF